MAWVYLTFAGLFEIVWAALMKQSDGFTKLTPTLLMLVAMVISFWLLTVAMRTVPLGTAYTVWVGIGAVGAFMVGVFFMGEAVNATRLLAVALIVSGIVLMKLSGTE